MTSAQFVFRIRLGAEALHLQQRLLVIDLDRPSVAVSLG
jgi:hypothetical protein